MVGATEFPSLLLQFFDESLKQRVIWRYRGAVSCPSYSTLPASFFRPLSLNYPVSDNTSPNWAFRSVLKVHNVLVLECPRMSYTQHSFIQSQIWFRGERAKFSGFTICPFPYNVVVCNPFFIPSYHPVQKELDFVPSKQRYAEIWQLDHPNFSDLIHMAPILNTSTPILSSEYGQKWFVELN